MTQTYEGGCHCGRVRFRVTADLSRVTECNCSICTKKGFLHLIVAPEKFELLSGKDALTTYRFNTGTAQHTFCATCGIHPFYVPRSDPDKIDVNVRCLDGVDVAAIKTPCVRRQELGACDDGSRAVAIVGIAGSLDATTVVKISNSSCPASCRASTSYRLGASKDAG